MEVSMRYLIHASILVAILAIGLISCTVQIDIAEVRKAIEESNAVFTEAYNSGDAAGVTALYTEDAILMPPDVATVQGREAIQEYWSKALESGLSDLKLEVVSVDGRGDLAYEIGKYSVMVPFGEAKVAWAGKYLVIWERQADGAWMMSVDISNNDGAMEEL
jgi:uncharacterized protein (TIGR02246 family)